MKQTITIIIILFLFSCANKTGRQDQKIIDRIEYIFNLKKRITENGWADFSNNKYDVPLIYYADTCCYVANPTENFMQHFQPKLIFATSELKIYQTKLLDSIPFHLETSITFEDSTNDYDYNSPFIKCMSYEATKKMIPGVAPAGARALSRVSIIPPVVAHPFCRCWYCHQQLIK